MPWMNFTPVGAFVTPATLANADPYLAWAESVGFADSIRVAQPMPPPRVPVLVELVQCKTPADLQLALGANGTLRGAYLGQTTRYCMALFSPAACVTFASAGNGVVQRFEFVMPVLPQRPPVVSRPAAAGAPIARARQAKGESVLLGVIDHGCPFAHANFRRAGSSRVLSLWDQDPNPAFGVAPAVGGVPPDFGYGREVNRSMLDAIVAARTVAGSVDEESCYELARYPELRPRVTHASHVLDQFIGPRQLGARLPADADSVPSWVRGTSNVADRADLVFVQLPRDAWADPSGNALAGCVLDGLRYILSCRGANTEKVVVNISCALFTGPHNGSSIFEQALQELVATERAAAPGLDLQIYLAAGNSRQSRWHADAQLPAGATAQVRLRVLPGSEAPTFVQVWLAPGAAAACATVTAPSGVATSPGMLGVGSGQTFVGIAGPLATALHTGSTARGVADPAVPNPSLLLLVIESTETPDRPGANAPHGEWTIDLTAASATGVRVYVSRNEVELGVALRGRPARLVDPAYDPERYMRECEDDPVGAAAATLTVRRSGTLSGVATGAETRAVGGYRLRPVPAPTTYSSSGPPQPYTSAACEESRALLGIRGAGSRSGSVVRLQGTSFSSPQAARAAANGTALVAAPAPADADRWGMAGIVQP